MIIFIKNNRALIIFMSPFSNFWSEEAGAKQMGYLVIISKSESLWFPKEGYLRFEWKNSFWRGIWGFSTNFAIWIFVLFLHAQSLLEDISGSPFGCVVRGAVKKADSTEREIELRWGATKASTNSTGSFRARMGFYGCSVLRQESWTFVPCCQKSLDKGYAWIKGIILGKTSPLSQGQFLRRAQIWIVICH